MEALSHYLVLTGTLSAGEALLLQKIISSPNLSRTEYLTTLQKFGFINPDEIFDNLQSKKLIATDNSPCPNWTGLKSLVIEIDNGLRKIINDLAQLQKQIVNSLNSEKHPTAAPASQRDISVSNFFAKYEGTTSQQSDKQLFSMVSLPAILLIEQLAENGLVNIQQKKHRRTISLSAEGAAVRYLIVHQEKLSPLNYDYLENYFLKPVIPSFKHFISKVNEKDRKELSNQESFFLELFQELAIINQEKKSFVLLDPQGSSPFSKKRSQELKKSISGFIPVYAKHLWEVINLLPNTPAKLKEELELGSSISGILKMLTKFQLTMKTESSSWKLTTKGEAFYGLSEEEFHAKFRTEFSDFPIFVETINFIRKMPGKTIGFMDLAGYFRASGVSNFNPAKALSVLRLMAQTRTGIQKGEQSRSYQLL
ncbi:MAG: hypothetical protein GF308_14515 [Candidatus Heimdallarchaeota archaeon]|nr:hypothetical protein [Candidatus Heimdallarchaeota archaeon]